MMLSNHPVLDLPLALSPLTPPWTMVFVIETCCITWPNPISFCSFYGGHCWLKSTSGCLSFSKNTLVFAMFYMWNVQYFLKHFISNVWMHLLVTYVNVWDLHLYRATDITNEQNRFILARSLISQLFHNFSNFAILDIATESWDIISKVKIHHCILLSPDIWNHGHFLVIGHLLWH